MRKKKKTIMLAKIRRYVRDICQRYDNLEHLTYPKCYTRPQEEIEKTAKKIYSLFKPQTRSSKRLQPKKERRRKVTRWKW